VSRTGVISISDGRGRVHERNADFGAAKQNAPVAVLRAGRIRTVAGSRWADVRAASRLLDVKLDEWSRG
jgi:hypothetical protein